MIEITIGNITIRPARTPGEVWIENQLGEGMAIREVLLQQALEKFFSENF